MIRLLLYTAMLLLPPLAWPCRMKRQAPGLIINEVLFDPVKDGFDYVEGFNRGSKPVDLQQISIANRNGSGQIASIRAVARSAIEVPPGGYFVITEDSVWLRRQYAAAATAIVAQPSSLPSFPDDEGEVVLLDGDGTVIDELDYDEDWHFPLISNRQGVALERIDPNAPTQDPQNWTSASSSSGFGTPGYANSQEQSVVNSGSALSVSTPVFSPDNDGQDDACLITYQMREPGSVANMKIYDVSGRPVRYILRNALLGTSGWFRWDGLDDKARPLSPGIYILAGNIFRLDGQVEKFKQTVTLALRY